MTESVITEFTPVENARYTPITVETSNGWRRVTFPGPEHVIREIMVINGKYTMPKGGEEELHTILHDVFLNIMMTLDVNIREHFGNFADGASSEMVAGKQVDYVVDDRFLIEMKYSYQGFNVEKKLAEVKEEYKDAVGVKVSGGYTTLLIPIFLHYTPELVSVFDDQFRAIIIEMINVDRANSNKGKMKLEKHVLTTSEEKITELMNNCPELLQEPFAARGLEFARRVGENPYKSYNAFLTDLISNTSRMLEHIIEHSLGTKLMASRIPILEGFRDLRTREDTQNKSIRDLAKSFFELNGIVVNDEQHLTDLMDFPVLMSGESSLPISSTGKRFDHPFSERIERKYLLLSELGVQDKSNRHPVSMYIPFLTENLKFEGDNWADDLARLMKESLLWDDHMGFVEQANQGVHPHSKLFIDTVTGLLGSYSAVGVDNFRELNEANRDIAILKTSNNHELKASISGKYGYDYKWKGFNKNKPHWQPILDKQQKIIDEVNKVLPTNKLSKRGYFKVSNKKFTYSDAAFSIGIISANHESSPRLVEELNVWEKKYPSLVSKQEAERIAKAKIESKEGPSSRVVYGTMTDLSKQEGFSELENIYKKFTSYADETLGSVTSLKEYNIQGKMKEPFAHPDEVQAEYNNNLIEESLNMLGRMSELPGFRYIYMMNKLANDLISIWERAKTKGIKKEAFIHRDYYHKIICITGAPNTMQTGPITSIRKVDVSGLDQDGLMKLCIKLRRDSATTKARSILITKDKKTLVIVHKPIRLSAAIMSDTIEQVSAFGGTTIIGEGTGFKIQDDRLYNMLYLGWRRSYEWTMDMVYTFNKTIFATGTLGRHELEKKFKDFSWSDPVSSYILMMIKGFFNQAQRELTNQIANNTEGNFEFVYRDPVFRDAVHTGFTTIQIVTYMKQICNKRAFSGEKVTSTTFTDMLVYRKWYHESRMFNNKDFLTDKITVTEYIHKEEVAKVSKAGTLYRDIRDVGMYPWAVSICTEEVFNSVKDIGSLNVKLVQKKHEDVIPSTITSSVCVGVPTDRLIDSIAKKSVNPKLNETTQNMSWRDAIVLISEDLSSLDEEELNELITKLHEEEEKGNIIRKAEKIEQYTFVRYNRLEGGAMENRRYKGLYSTGLKDAVALDVLSYVEIYPDRPDPDLLDLFLMVRKAYPNCSHGILCPKVEGGYKKRSFIEQTVVSRHACVLLENLIRNIAGGIKEMLILVPELPKMAAMETLSSNYSNNCQQIAMDLRKFGETLPLESVQVIAGTLHKMGIFKQEHLEFVNYITSFLYNRKILQPAHEAEYLEAQMNNKKFKETFADPREKDEGDETVYKSEINRKMVEINRKLKTLKSLDKNTASIMQNLTDCLFDDLNARSDLNPSEKTWYLEQGIGFILGALNVWGSVITAMCMRLIKNAVNHIFIGANADGFNQSDDMLLNNELPPTRLQDISKEHQSYRRVPFGEGTRRIDVLRYLGQQISNGERYKLIKRQSREGVVYKMLVNINDDEDEYHASYGAWISLTYAWWFPHLFGCNGSYLKYIDSQFGEMLQIQFISGKLFVPILRYMVTMVVNDAPTSYKRAIGQTTMKAAMALTFGCTDLMFAELQVLGWFLTLERFGKEKRYDTNQLPSLNGVPYVTLADFIRVGSDSNMVRLIALSKRTDELGEYLDKILYYTIVTCPIYKKKEGIKNQITSNTVEGAGDFEGDDINVNRIDFILTYSAKQKVQQIFMQFMEALETADPRLQEIKNRNPKLDPGDILKMRRIAVEHLRIIKREPVLSEVISHTQGYLSANANTQRFSTKGNRSAFQTHTLRSNLLTMPNIFNEVESDSMTVIEAQNYIKMLARSDNLLDDTATLELRSIEDKNYAEKVKVMSTRFTKEEIGRVSNYYIGAFRFETLTRLTLTGKTGYSHKSTETAIAAYVEGEIYKQFGESYKLSSLRRDYIRKTTNAEGRIREDGAVRLSEDGKNKLKPFVLEESEVYSMVPLVTHTEEFKGVYNQVSSLLKALNPGVIKISENIKVYTSIIAASREEYWMKVPEGSREIGSILRSRYAGSIGWYPKPTLDEFIQKTVYKKPKDPVTELNLRIYYVSTITDTNRFGLSRDMEITVGTKELEDYEQNYQNGLNFSKSTLAEYNDWRSVGQASSRTEKDMALIGLIRRGLNEGAEAVLDIIRGRGNVRVGGNPSLYYIGIKIDSVYIVKVVPLEREAASQKEKVLKDETRWITNSENSRLILALYTLLESYIAPEQYRHELLLSSKVKGNLRGDIEKWGNLLKLNDGEGNLPITFITSYSFWTDVTSIVYDDDQSNRMKVYKSHFKKGRTVVAPWITAPESGYYFIGEVGLLINIFHDRTVTEAGFMIRVNNNRYGKELDLNKVKISFGNQSVPLTDTSELSMHVNLLLSMITDSVGEDMIHEQLEGNEEYYTRVSDLITDVFLTIVNSVHRLSTVYRTYGFRSIEYVQTLREYRNALNSFNSFNFRGDSTKLRDFINISAAIQARHISISLVEGGDTIEAKVITLNSEMQSLKKRAETDPAASIQYQNLNNNLQLYKLINELNKTGERSVPGTQKIYMPYSYYSLIIYQLVSSLGWEDLNSIDIIYN